jgi:hypothetical protein
MIARITPGPSGFDFRTFDCAKCGHAHKALVANDPMKSNAQGWIVGELKPPV